ncbi:MAG: hypothetical protein RLZZ04_1524 [Cyanobacteriota bacterium]|jgi:hypothetical protein
MRISIEKIEAEKIREVEHTTSLKIVGGKTQYGSVDVSGTVGNSTAGASLYFFNSGANPVSEFGASIDVRKTDTETSSSSSSFIKLR